jgi:hypothetical protein
MSCDLQSSQKAKAVTDQENQILFPCTPLKGRKFTAGFAFKIAERGGFCEEPS